MGDIVIQYTRKPSAEPLGDARAEGDAATHSSSLVHGVTRLTRGARYSLIVFFGDEPAVRRELVEGVWVRTLVPR